MKYRWADSAFLGTAKAVLAALLATSIFLPPSPCQATPCITSTVWSVYFNDPSNTDDFMNALSIDSSGNVIGGGHTGGNWRVRKYDSKGTFLWQQTYNGGGIDEIYGSAIDSSNNIIMAGQTAVAGNSYDWLIRKYTPAGGLLWSIIWHPTGGYEYDAAAGCAVDSSDNIYVVGFETRNDLGQSSNLVLRKYDPDGNLLWGTSYHDSTTGGEGGFALDLDSNGYPIVSGDSIQGGQYDALIQKWTPDGNLVWSRTLDGGSHLWDETFRLAMDTSDNIYVTGVTNGSGGNFASWLFKYSPSGVFQWSRSRLGASTGANWSMGVLQDTDGYIVTLSDEFNASGNSDMRLTKWDTNGNDVCAWTYANPAGTNDHATRTLAIGPDGMIVAGTSEYRSDLGQAYNWRINKYGYPVSLACALSVTPTETTVGSYLTVVLSVSNTGGATATSVVPSLPSPGPLVSAISGPTPASVATLVRGASAQFTWTWSASGAGVVGFDAAVSANDPVSSSVISCSSSASATLVAPITALPPVISVVKRVDASSAIPGEPVAWSILVANIGADTVYGIDIVDTIPAMTSFTGQSFDCPDPANTVAYSLAGVAHRWSGALELLPGQSATVVINGTTNACATGTVLNRAVVKASGLGGETGQTASAPSFTLSMGIPALTVSSAHSPTTPAAGGTVNFVVTVRNSGTATITDYLVIADTLPTWASVTTHDEPGGLLFGQTGQLVSWNGAGFRLDPGQAVSVTVTGTIAPCASGAASNRGWARGANACYAPQASGLDSLTVTGPGTLGGGLATAVTSACPVAGATVDWLITFTNSGTSAITGIKITDTLPAQATYSTEQHPAGLAFTQSGGVAGWEGPVALAPGATLTVTITGTLAPGATGTATNKAWVLASDSCGTLEKAATASFSLSAPALACALSYSPVPAYAGKQLTLAVTLSNPGPSPLAGVLPAISLAAGAGLVSPAGALPSSPVTIPAGGSRTWTVAYDTLGTGTVSFSVTAGGTDSCGQPASTACTLQVAIGTAEPIDKGTVRIVGGIRGYLNLKRGEQANILVRPEQAGEIVVRIFDLRGRLVREIRQQAAGGRTETVKWDGKDSLGNDVAPGGYPIIVTAPGIEFRDKLGVLR